MTTGSSSDIQNRIKGTIPRRWFSWTALIRDAIIGGLSDAAAWCYGLVGYARAQTRIATAYGIWLDLIAYDFLGRFLIRSGAPDDTFRARILAIILQERVTRAGMVRAITALTGHAPTIFEPWNTFDTGGYSGKRSLGRPQYGSFGYGVGQGGYGSMALPAQTFMKVTRGAGSGVPDVDGYGGTIAGFGAGAIEYVGSDSELSGITNAMIYDLINKTKPTGSTCWVIIN